MTTSAKALGRLTPDQILELLPQQEPFRFVDRILELDDEHIVATYRFRPEADFYRGKFDEAGINHLLQYLAGQKKIPFGRWWKFIRKAPGVWLINIFDLARPPIPDILVVVSTSVDAQMERLRSTGEELELYQNEEFLARWQEAYGHVGRVLKRRRRLRLLEVDASELGLDEIATVVADTIKMDA